MHRLKRIGVPLLIGAFTIVPIQSLWWLFTHRGAVDSGAIVWTVLLGWLWGLHHLWFLWVLLLLVGIFVALTAVGAKFSDRRIWWLLIPLVLVPQLLMTEPTWGADTSTQLWTNPVVLAYYACFFMFGALMYETGLSTGRLRTFALVPVIPVFFVGVRFEFGSEAGSAHFASSALQVVYAWAMCFGLMGFVQDHRFEGSLLGSLRFRCVLLDLSLAPSADLRRAVDCRRADAERSCRSGAHHRSRHCRPAGRLPVRGEVHVDRRDAEWAANVG